MSLKHFGADCGLSRIFENVPETQYGFNLTLWGAPWDSGRFKGP